MLLMSKWFRNKKNTKKLRQNLKKLLLTQRLSRIRKKLKKPVFKKTSKIRRRHKSKFKKLLKRRLQKKKLKKRLLRRKRLRQNKMRKRKQMKLPILNKKKPKERRTKNRNQLLKN